MSFIKRKDRKYEALSLVEMLITLVIVAIILIVVSETLVALIKASAISSARSTSRGESEFILELLEKEISNSESDDIRLFTSTPGQITVDDMGVVNYNGSVSQEIDITDPAKAGEAGNEIHMHPIGSEDWICVGYVQGLDEHGNKVGYIMRNSSSIPTNKCFEGTDPKPVFLSSEEVNIERFDIRFVESGGSNYTFFIDLELLPVHWIPGESSKYKPQYLRQTIVSTEKLTF